MPTNGIESDGTFERNATTLVVVQAQAAGISGTVIPTRSGGGRAQQ